MRTKQAKGIPRNGTMRKAIAGLAAREAYHDALYAILLEQVERSLRDPRRSEKVNSAMRELLTDILKDFE